MPDLSQYTSFVPGNLVLIVEHTDDLTAQQLFDRLVDQYQFLNDLNTLIGTQIPDLPSNHFSTYETVFDDNDDLWQVLQNRDRSLPRLSYLTLQLENNEQVIDWIIRVFHETSNSSHPNHIRLAAAIPNWLFSSMPNEPPGPPDMGGGGGPGTKPRPSSIRAEYYKVDVLYPDAPWNFKIKDIADLSLSELHQLATMSQNQLDALKEIHSALAQRWESSGENIEVVILDTAPPTDPPVLGSGELWLKKAYNDWKDEHPLIKSLLRPSDTRPFENISIEYEDSYSDDGVIYDPASGEFNFARSRADDYPHFAMDHGIFVAGVIHTLVPNAKLRLIEVLNARAYGSFHIIANGIQKALTEKNPETTLIVNMSLAYSFPPIIDLIRDQATLKQYVDLTELIIKFAESIGIDPKNLINLIGNADFNEFLKGLFLWGLGWIVDSVYAYDPEVTAHDIQNGNGKVIAAAGNDGLKPNGVRHDARFPAAFDNVIGVAAFNHSGDYAHYSSKADIPPRHGIATYGGNEDPDLEHWADLNRGMLGLYIGKFPDPNDPLDNKVTLTNNFGWARWSGTSFAAPVVTGCMALLISQGKTTQEALAVIQDAFPEPANQPHLLPIIQVAATLP